MLRETLLLTGAAFAFTLGGVAMKFSQGLTKAWPTMLLFLLFSTGAALQTIAMRHSEMGTTYVIVLGVEAVLAFLLGIWVFSEPVTPVRILALLLIATGILLLKK